MKRAAIAIGPRELDLFFRGPSSGPERLTELLPGAQFFTPSAVNADWPGWLNSARPNILITAWSTPLIPDGLSDLQYVCHVCGSVKKTVPRSLIERGVVVTNWGENVSEGLAEAALLLALSGLRRSHYFCDQMRHKRAWPTYPVGTKTLFECKVGIHGFGASARKLVSLLKPFRVQVSAYSKNVPDEMFRSLGVRRCDSIEELFASSEVLFEMEALIAETQGVVTERLLRLLPPDATFVNVARGALVDEEAAIRVASEGRIRLALDVYAEEPLPVDSPLRGMPEATLFPHVASPTDDRLYRCGDFALENLSHFLHGEPLSARVNLDVFDRST
jgi:phosphoglycerate dehydrogenase-like enzyme